MSFKFKEFNEFNGLLSVANYFKDEKVCLAYIEEWLWGGKIRCRQCGFEDPYRYKDGKTLRCRNCKCTYTAKVGTIFGDSKLPLQKWFMAMYLVANHRGISSPRLASDLEVTQKTAWFMLQRIRGTMDQLPEEQLKGVIEMDESFVGGKNRNRHKDKKVFNMPGREYKDKTPVFGMKERGGELRTFVVQNTSAASLIPIIKNNVEKGATIYTDDWKSYRQLSRRYKHTYVDHSAGRFKIGDACTNGIESFWKQLKGMINYIYNYVSPKHLQRYADELTFRFNTRDMKNGQRFRLLFNFIECRLKYKDLII